MNSKMLSIAGRLFVFSLAASSVQAIPVPQPQTPDAAALESCANNGEIICTPDGTAFFVCDWNKKVPMGTVAAGNVCKNGQIQAVDGGPPVAPVAPVAPAPTGAAPSAAPVVVPPTAPAPTPEPQPIVNVPAKPDSSSDTVTSTITSVVETRIASTSTIVVTMPGPAPSGTPESPATPNPPSGKPIVLTEKQVLAVAPSSNTCSGAQFPDECATASDAVANINKAFAKHGITTPGEAASLLSIMAFESGDFKFNINHFPGRPGQGTKAMLMVNFIVTYAQTFGSTDNIAPGLSESNIDSQSDDVKNKVRAVVLDNERSFGAAAWFYNTKCSDEVKKGLRKAASTEAWEAYITQCVGTTVTDDRKAGFIKAAAALTQ